LGPTEPVLTVALVGGTGVGKSTLINALAGHPIAEAGEFRPTTRRIQVYHHRDDAPAGLAADAAGAVTLVPHDRPELRLKLIVDSPDLDSFVVRHRATTKALLKKAGLVLYVFSPDRYLEERTWSVLRQETAFSACAVVLNKADRVGSAEELDQITADLRERFAGLGLGHVRIFRVCARAHVSAEEGTSAPSAAAVDEMAALRSFLERELQASEIARLIRSQRALVLDHLRAQVERLAPEHLPGRLDEVARAAAARAEAAAGRLAAALAEPLAAVEAELAPLVALRRHEQFWGPFRAWLAATDFLGYGLTNLIRRVLGRLPADRGQLIEHLLGRSGTPAVAALLRAEADALQDLVYARDLPVAAWRRLTGAIDASRLLTEVAAEVEAQFAVTAARVTGWRQSVVAVASTLGGLVPAALVLVGLVVMTRDVFVGNYVGFPLLWHLLAMVILFFLALQGVVGAVLPGGSRWLSPGFGPRAVGPVLARTLAGWVASYRAELEADLADLREPLAVLQAAAADGGGSVLSALRPTPANAAAPTPPRAQEAVTSRQSGEIRPVPVPPG
ncbi:MAG TPA: GTPase domain-containing protein, partial [Isosphaeraceae bacterium]